MKTIDEGPLPAAALEALLLDVAAAGPPDDVAARIRGRVLKRVADGPHPAAPSTIDIRRADGWQPFAAAAEGRAEMKVLHDDGLTMTWLVRLQPGCVLAGHDHAGTEECLVLEGDFWLNDVRYGPGDYQIAFAGTRHHSARTEGGCLVFVRSPSPQRAAGAAA
jgi:quercetin dioxygenase-like cupin family protein